MTVKEYLILFIISFIIVIVTYFVSKLFSVSSEDEPIKWPIWLILLLVICIFIPIANIIAALTVLIISIISMCTDWKLRYDLKNTKIVKFLNKKI